MPNTANANWTLARITALLDDDKAVNRAIIRLWLIVCGERLHLRLNMGEVDQLQRWYMAVMLHEKLTDYRAAREFCKRYASTLLEVAQEKEGVSE